MTKPNFIQTSNRPIHPGEVLRQEYLNYPAIKSQLLRYSGIKPWVLELIAEELILPTEQELKQIAKVVLSSEQFWLRLQDNYVKTLQRDHDKQRTELATLQAVELGFDHQLFIDQMDTFDHLARRPARIDYQRGTLFYFYSPYPLKCTYVRHTANVQLYRSAFLDKDYRRISY